MPYINLKMPLCSRCNHPWLPRDWPPVIAAAIASGEDPKQALRDALATKQIETPDRCARCKDPNWNRPRVHVPRKERSAAHVMANKAKRKQRLRSGLDHLGFPQSAIPEMAKLKGVRK